MTALEFKYKLENFLDETVGKDWKWLDDNALNDCLIIHDLCIWNLEPEEE